MVKAFTQREKERFHMVGAALAVEVKNSIIPDVWYQRRKRGKKKGNNTGRSLNMERSRKEWDFLLNSHIIMH